MSDTLVAIGFTLGGAVLGGAISWLVTHLYYVRQLRDAETARRELDGRLNRLAADLGLDIRAVVEAVKAGDDSKIDAAVQGLNKRLSEMQERQRKVELRSMVV